ncbi:MAG: sigma factor-like helix-turn-helix DNA-binding protein [Clostridia bacterium]
MRSYYGQYPELYGADDTRYTYFYDDGKRVTLIAGEDGVTQEWIHALRLEHRKEYNLMRRGTAANRSQIADDKPMTLSLDQYLDDAGYEGRPLIDETSDVEAHYIATIEASERRERIQKALASLTPEQRELLIKVKVQQVPLKTLAASLGIKYQSLQSRLETIQKTFLKNF